MAMLDIFRSWYREKDQDLGKGLSKLMVVSTFSPPDISSFSVGFTPSRRKKEPKGDGIFQHKLTLEYKHAVKTTVQPMLLREFMMTK